MVIAVFFLEKMKMQNELEFEVDEVEIRMRFQERLAGSCTRSLEVGPASPRSLLGAGRLT